jgi:hypothetical protein
MKIDQVLTELVIFAKERGADADDHLRRIISAAERHLYRLDWIRAKRALFSRKPACERCGAPSSSGILCWECLSAAPHAIRHAFRNASGIEGMRLAAEKIRTWIKTSAREERRRHAA